MSADVIPFLPRGSCMRCGGHHDTKACALSDAAMHLEDRFGDGGGYGREGPGQAFVYLVGLGFEEDVANEAASAWWGPH